MKVKLKMSFVDILGENDERYGESERKKRWEEWKALAENNGDIELVRFWSDSSSCIGCVHLNESWCDLQGLPCTVNPVLSFNHALPGMACMGVGKEIGDK